MTIKPIKSFFRNKIKQKITAVLFIFLFAFCLRLWNLNLAGRVVDEAGQGADGIKIIKFTLNGDFNNPFLWKNMDHPVLMRYIRGLASYFDIASYSLNGDPILNYDLTYNRLVSVILTSLTCVLVLLIGIKYISYFVGITAGIILAMIPVLLGHSQIAMYEPFVIFFYTATVYSFLLYLENPSNKRLVFTGIILGLAIQSKESNILLVPQILIIYFFWYWYVGRKEHTKHTIKKILYIFLIGFATFMLIWPTIFFKFNELLKFQLDLRFGVHTSIPEVFYGKLFLNRRFYYFVYFLITTPLAIYFLLLTGLLSIDTLNYKSSRHKLQSIFKMKLFKNKLTTNFKLNKKYKWIFYVFIIWFAFPFIQSLYHKREQGIRYIIEIYAPMSIIAAMGFDYLISSFTKKVWTKYLFLIPLIFYQFIILLRITPYYLDYFNILVGGAKNVYKNKLFHLAWWGEGNREAGLYLAKNAPAGSKIGNALSFKHTLPPLKKLKVYPYKNNENYNYVLVDFYNIVRMGFDDTKIKQNYKVVYSVMADGAHLVEVYKHK